MACEPTWQPIDSRPIPSWFDDAGHEFREDGTANQARKPGVGMWGNRVETWGEEFACRDFVSGRSPGDEMAEESHESA